MATASTSTSTAQLLSAPCFPCALSSSPRAGGILLNRTHASASPPSSSASSHFPPVLPPPSTSTNTLTVLQPPHVPARAASAHSNSSDEVLPPSAALTPRTKIRFAPLPDPRRAVAITDDGVVYEMFEDSGTISFGTACGCEGSSPPHGVEEGMYAAAKPASIYSTGEEEEEEDLKPRKTRPRKGSWSSASKKLLSPLLGKSPTRNGLLSASSGQVEEDDAVSDAADDMGGSGLHRRTSTGGLFGANPLRSSKEMRRKEELLGGGERPPGVPLRLSSTLESSDIENRHREKPRMHGRTHSAENANAGSVGRRKMLNGRVYGAKRQQKERKELVEPEFIEWGYGGVGSLGGAKSVYQEDKDEGGGERVELEEEGDDGSGMSWVRKRRREKERKEREDRLKREREESELPVLPKKEPDVVQPAPPAPAQRDVSPRPTATQNYSSHSSARNTPTQSTLSSAISSRSQSPHPSEGSTIRPGTSTEEKHHYATVNVPPPTAHHHHHHHHHHHSHSHGHHYKPEKPSALRTDSAASGASTEHGEDHLHPHGETKDANMLQLNLLPATPTSPLSPAIEQVEQTQETELSSHPHHHHHQQHEPGAVVEEEEEEESEEESESEGADESSSSSDEDVEPDSAVPKTVSSSSLRTDSSSETEDDIIEAEETKRRLTSAGAGVEKVSARGRRS